MKSKTPNHFNKKHIKLSDLQEMKSLLRSCGLNTVCEEAKCPNIGECFHKGTATFLILGNICSRNCTFCSVTKGSPQKPDENEPLQVAQAIEKLGLKYAVITSVTRDDLEDFGAGHFKKTMEQISLLNPDTKIELLIPDFNGNTDSLDTVFSTRPFVLNHNLETVPSLYPNVRPMADYYTSLYVLETAKDYGLTTKSGIMLGMGEKEDEVIQTMRDLVSVNCDILTLGQYLAPQKNNYKVHEFITDNRFAFYKNAAMEMGFKNCSSSTYVRSSYMADTLN